MPTTPLGLRFPAGNASVNVNGDIANLATDADAAMTPALRKTIAVQQQTFFDTTFSGTGEAGVAQLAIADPGWAYVLDVSACVQVASTAGVQVTIRVRLDSVPGGAMVSQPGIRSGALPAGEIIMVPLSTFTTGTLTGAHTLICTAQLTVGAGNWNVPATGSILNAIIRPA